MSEKLKEFEIKGKDLYYGGELCEVQRKTNKYKDEWYHIYTNVISKIKYFTYEDDFYLYDYYDEFKLVDKYYIEYRLDWFIYWDCKGEQMIYYRDRKGKRRLKK